MFFYPILQKNTNLAFNAYSMSSEAFEIHLPQFEGPFDLLLFFIERDELNIHDIPIARITNEFLDFLQKMSALNVELASEFIVVAATLMRIKAKTLLPRPDLDEDGNEIDLKEDLVQKLVLYKKFKSVSGIFKQLEEERLKSYSRGSIEADLRYISQYENPEEELSSFSLYRLMTVYDRLIKQHQNRSQPVRHTVIPYPYTIEQQKAVILKFLEGNQKMDFIFIRSESENRVQLVYNFLAILELLQQQLIEIQSGTGYNNFLIKGKSI